ncbi:DUF4407 domain-containing protein [Parvibaculum sp.]|uniref:DUF4407 domain-containing protein n=1 Tax=Parvibaculum sp. TaxID=2024848 RepID=UPI0026216F98|nr:DUF4407 domain-containing protein [Parvibaculum sp.]MCW5726225.1 DUF4407 domain-containing protein [Parvibaculum sp.]
MNTRSTGQTALNACWHLAGVDHDRIRQMPFGDRQLAARIGIQLVFSATFLFVIFVVGLSVGFGKDLGADLGTILIAAIVACVVLGLDSQILQSDFHQQGIDLARDRGLDDGAGRWARFRRPMSGALRLVLSVIIAFALVRFFELRLYADDIQRYLDAEHRAANASLVAKAEGEYDHDLAQLGGRISAADDHLETLKFDLAKARARALAPSSEELELARLTTQVDELRSQKTAFDIEAARRDGDAINEKVGIKEKEGQSGIEGRGPLYRQATERAALARQESIRRANEIAELQTRIDAIRTKKPRPPSVDAASVESTLLKDIRETEQNRAEFVGERGDALQNRETRIASAVRSHPDYVPLQAGFIGRATALEKIVATNDTAWWFSFWAKALIIVVEIAAVASKLFFSAPTLYAVKTALDFERAVASEIGTYRSLSYDVRAKTLRDDLALEDLNLKLLEKRGTRLRREATLREMYMNNGEVA